MTDRSLLWTLVVVAALAFFIPFARGFVKGVLGAIRQKTQVHPCAVMHIFVPIDARPIQMNDLPYTTVLLRCSRCDGHTALTYPGNWPIETLLKKESDVAREIRTLEGLVR